MSVSSMRSDSSSSRRKGSVETRGEFEIYISDVVVHPRYTVRSFLSLKC